MDREDSMEQKTENILEVRHLKKYFRKEGRQFPAVDDVSFAMRTGSCLGLVGESGCGKTTTAGLITGQLSADAGTVIFLGKDRTTCGKKTRKKWLMQIQMVFQSPTASFDPRRKLGYSIAEGLRNTGMSGKEAAERAKDCMKKVDLDPAIADRFPHEVSGGQCQRAALARALVLEPKLLICDEATSALDVSVQMQIVELLKRLRKDLQLSVLMICHDLALVQELCDQVLVMQNGKIVESGETEEVLENPKTDYTRELIKAAL